MFREHEGCEHHNHEHHHIEHGPHPFHGQYHKRGSLRIWVFSILQQGPKNGAEIVNQLDSISQGHWRPSPGSIYPLLDQLFKEESIRKLEDGRYEITEKGKKEFELPYEMHAKQPHSADGAVEKMNSYISYLEDLKRMDSSKISPITDKLKNIRDRLTTLIDTE